MKHNLRVPRSKNQVIAGNVVISIVMAFFLFALVNWSDGRTLYNPSLTQQFNLQFSYNTKLKTDNVNDIVNAEFTPSKINRVPGSFAQHYHWYKITMTNTLGHKEKFRLVIDNPLVDKMDIYEYKNLQFEKVLSIGDTQEDVSISNRVLANYSFELSSNQYQTFFINLDNNGSSIPSINIMQDSVFKSYSNNLHLVWGAFVAVVLVMVVYNSILYLGLRDIAIVYYVVYLVCIGLLVSQIHGFGYYFFGENLQRFLGNNLAISQSLVAITALQFGSKFLNIDYRAGFVFRFKQIALMLLVSFCLISLFLTEAVASNIFSIIQVFTYISAFLMIRYKFKTRFIWTRFYIMSWLPFFIGAAIAMLLFAGLIEYTYVTRHALLFSVIIEVTLISSALADRMGDQERTRIFNATHDVKTGLANQFYLKYFLENANNHLENEKTTVIAVNIKNYESIFPYLNSYDQKRLIKGMNDYFINKFEQFHGLRFLSRKLEIKSVIANQSQLIYVVPINDVDLVSKMFVTINEKDNFNPFSDEIHFRVPCVFSAVILDKNIVSAQRVINDLQQCFNYAIENRIKYSIYNKNMTRDNVRRVKLANDLEEAIEKDELQLFHQPQMTIDGKNETQYSEVLIRWIHPELGFIPPDEFVLIAEQTGLIKQLTKFVITKAFNQHNEIRKKYNIEPVVSINVSANDFSRAGFFEEVSKMVEQCHVDPEFFTLEITETSHQENTKCFHNNIAQLKKMGFKLAIDDFGTGYSSLTYISDLPFDELKIDRSFVLDLLNSDRQHNIVSATIQMAVKLGLSVTAEGIEDEATLKELIKLQCHKIQGYFYAKPMDFESYKKWIQSEGDQ